ncbi:hypothetical protein BD779DRAFT_1666764 [Infundibulicybe gibba]|nr:hypothetical protein BD779DRAFT_1666764 [Infundibulicybe gibba]
MSDKTARTHTHTSNRTKARKVLEKKVAFKNVLDNPFRIAWYVPLPRPVPDERSSEAFRPSVPINVQSKILELLVSMLGGIAEHQSARGRDNRKRKRLDRAMGSDSANSGTKKVRLEGDGSINNGTETKVTTNTDNIPTATDAPSSGKSGIPLPQEILRHLTIGINEVTKCLESQVRGTGTSSTIHPTGPADPPTPPAQIKIVFTCRADVNPPILVAHIPHLVAAFNSAPKTSPIKLVPLPQGAEALLAQALGLRRVSILAADIKLSLPEQLVTLLDSVPTLTAVWLAPPPVHKFVPTHIKQIRTTAPKDMRAAKEQRAQGRQIAKLRRKETGKK